MRNANKHEKRKHTKKHIWWDLGTSVASCFGDKKFAKRYSQIIKQKLKRSKSNGVSEAIRIFNLTKERD